MAKVVWEKIDRIQCDRVKEEVDLLEERVYPDEITPDPSQPYQVRARKCAQGVECNLVGFRCRWSFANPDYDPFAGR